MTTRKQHYARQRKHAQRTPLPPRGSTTIRDAREKLREAINESKKEDKQQ